MKLLVDANIPAQIVTQLRRARHDVVYAAEQTEGISDERWLAEARAAGRTLVTDDKDFGELVFRRRLLNGSIILLRLYRMPPRERVAWLESRWADILAAPQGSFVVVTERKMRIRRPT